LLALKESSQPCRFALLVKLKLGAKVARLQINRKLKRWKRRWENGRRAGCLLVAAATILRSGLVEAVPSEEAHHRPAHRLELCAGPRDRPVVLHGRAASANTANNQHDDDEISDR
jgi:hypothetical protein